MHQGYGYDQGDGDAEGDDTYEGEDGDGEGEGEDDDMGEMDEQDLAQMDMYYRQHAVASSMGMNMCMNMVSGVSGKPYGAYPTTFHHNGKLCRFYLELFFPSQF